MKMTMIALSLLFFLALGCTGNGERVTGTGRIAYMDFEGGFYGIVADNGDDYLPENLGADFQEDSLRVYFEGIVTDRTTTVQWGRTISLSRIERIR